MRNKEINSDANSVAKYICEKIDLNNACLSDEYYYQSLPLCVLDSVFSIGVKYSGVRALVIRYCEYTNQQRIRTNKKSLPPKHEQEAISTFIDFVAKQDIAELSKNVLSLQRTSSTNGILKTEAAVKFAECLKKYEVEYIQDVSKILNNSDFEGEIKRIPGQRSGISLGYFFMLSGCDDLIKPDRMIINFLKTALNRRNVDAQEAIILMRDACRILLAQYSGLSPRLLDHVVWSYQRSKKD